MSSEPVSVIRGQACPVCWRPFGNETRYQQTLDGVSRYLCAGCYTTMYPITPPGLEGYRPVHMRLDPDALGWVKGNCPTCGSPVEGPPEARSWQCIACATDERYGSVTDGRRGEG